MIKEEEQEWGRKGKGRRAEEEKKESRRWSGVGGGPILREIHVAYRVVKMNWIR